MLHGAGYADTTLAKKQTFWRDVYGFDYSPVLECWADEPVVEHVDSDNLVPAVSRVSGCIRALYAVFGSVSDACSAFRDLFKGHLGAFERLTMFQDVAQW